MREESCCFTGHRSLPPARQEAIARRLEQTVADLYQRGVRNYYAGGALGFDTLAAQTVLRLRDRCPGMRLLLALPCPTQAKGWKPGDAAEYERIKHLADETVYVSQAYTSGCMYRRNRYLVDHSAICLCYLTQGRGGTAYTVRYAVEQGVKVVNLAGE